MSGGILYCDYYSHRGGGDTFLSNLKKPIQIQRENIIQGPPSRGLSK